MKNITRIALFLVLSPMAGISAASADDDCSKIQTDIQEKNLSAEVSAVPSNENKEDGAKTSNEVKSD